MKGTWVRVAVRFRPVRIERIDVIAERKELPSRTAVLRLAIDKLYVDVCEEWNTELHERAENYQEEDND